MGEYFVSNRDESVRMFGSDLLERTTYVHPWFAAQVRVSRARRDQAHMRHHFLDPDEDYGVSSPLWDIVFRTYGGKKIVGRA